MLELLYEALNSKFGIVVRTNDVERLRQQLYNVRKQDPDLAILSFLVSRTAPNSELWILKNESKDSE